jgi:hypothetical protein
VCVPCESISSHLPVDGHLMRSPLRLLVVGLARRPGATRWPEKSHGLWAVPSCSEEDSGSAPAVQSRTPGSRLGWRLCQVSGGVVVVVVPLALGTGRWNHVVLHLRPASTRRRARITSHVSRPRQKPLPIRLPRGRHAPSSLHSPLACTAATSTASLNRTTSPCAVIQSSDRLAMPLTPHSPSGNPRSPIPFFITLHPPTS